MKNENSMKMDQFDVNVKVNGIIVKLAREAKKHNVTVNTIIGDIYKSCAGSQANAQVTSVLGDEEVLSSLLNKEDLDFLYANGRIAFESLFETLTQHHPVTTLPSEVCSLILSEPLMFPPVDEDEVIYLPFAGLSDFAAAKPNLKFVGEEMNQQIWALGEVRNFFYSTNATILCNDSMKLSAKYKNIIAIPPFGMRGDMSIDNIIKVLFERLEVGGTMAIMVPLNFLSAPAYDSLRRMLVKKHALRQVCLFPSNLLSNTSISYAILTIDNWGCEMYDCEGKICNQADESYFVRFVDYTSFVRDNRQYGTLYKLDVEAIRDAEISDIAFADRQESFNITITSDILLAEDTLNINPRFRLIENKLVTSLQEGEKLIPLGELVMIYNKAEVYGGYVETKKIRVQDLASNIIEGKKNFLGNEGEMVRENRFKVLIEDNLLLVSRVGNNLKPTIFEYVEGHQLAYSENIIPLQLCSDLVSVEYLQSQMTEEYFIQQVNCYRTTLGATSIAPAHLMKCKVKVASISLQQEVDRQIREKIAKELVLKLGVENQDLRDAQHNQYVTMMRERKHAIGQVLNQLKPGVKMLLSGIKRGPLACETIVSGFNGITAIEQLNRVNEYTLRVVDLIEHLTDEHQYGVPENLLIGALIDEYTRKYIGHNFDYEVIHPQFTLRVGEQAPDAANYYHEVKIAKSDFFQILDNIVSNAVKYGFTQEEKQYRIRILVEDSYIGKQEAVKVTVVNNGNPLVKNMDGKRVLTYGQSSSNGKGIGGWQVKNIVEYYGGTVKVENNDGSKTDGYTVAYVMTFPVVNLINIDIDEV